LHGVCRTAKFFESKEVEGLWKEAVQGWFTVLSRYITGETEGNQASVVNAVGLLS
jgi:hypothetical protein